MNKPISNAERGSASPLRDAPAAELDAITWGAEEAVKAMATYQAESLRFLAKRTYCNLEFLRRLRHCGNWQELAEAQQSWFKECAADYGEELSRLAATGFELAQSDFAPLQRLLYQKPRGAGNGARG